MVGRRSCDLAAPWGGCPVGVEGAIHGGGDPKLATRENETTARVLYAAGVEALQEYTEPAVERSRGAFRSYTVQIQVHEVLQVRIVSK
jgi:hypothetical protein